MGKDLQGQELGKGFTQRKDGRYYARAQIDGVSVTKYGWNLAKLKAEFRRECQRVKLEHSRPEYIVKDMTLNEWFEIWYEVYKKPFLKKSSWKSYRRQYDNYFGKFIGEKHLKELMQIDIQMATGDLLKLGRSGKSIQEALGKLRMCIDVAVANMLLPANPTIGISMPKTGQVKKRVFTHKEEQLILEYLEEHNDWYKEMFQFLLVTGLRIGECGALQDEDIDFVNKCIYIKRNLFCEYDHGIKSMELLEPKSTCSVRIIPFFGETERILRQQIKKRNALKKSLSIPWRAPEEFGNLVFVTTTGAPVTRYVAEDRAKNLTEQINKMLVQRAIDMGQIPVEIQKITPHAFRHTFCTRLFEKGMRPEIVQKIMGHANYSTTLEYTHILEDMIQAEAKKIGDFLD